MTDDVDDEADDAPDGAQGEQSSLMRRIATELFRLHAAQATGELAALRRIDRRSVPPAAFYRLVARAGMGDAGTKGVLRWAAIVNIMAQRPDALRARGLGEALKAIGLSEQRLDMLLNARGTALQDLARRTALRLARSDEGLPYRDLCQLLVYDGRGDPGDKTRIRIAQSYQRASGNGDKAQAAGSNGN